MSLRVEKTFKYLTFFVQISVQIVWESSYFNKAAKYREGRSFLNILCTFDPINIGKFPRSKAAISLFL